MTRRRAVDRKRRNAKRAWRRVLKRRRAALENMANALSAYIRIEMKHNRPVRIGEILGD